MQVLLCMVEAGVERRSRARAGGDLPGHGSVSVLGLGDTLRGDSVLPGFAMALAELFADD